MRLADEISLRRLPQQREDQEPEAEILLSGRATGTTLNGAVLEAAVQWQGYYLLFITDDVPYEEALRIVLLDADLQPLDAALIGGMYTTGHFSGMCLRPPDEIGFRFIGDTDWTVRLLSAPAFRWPFVSEPRGVSRRFGFSRRFVVDGHPVPG